VSGSEERFGVFALGLQRFRKHGVRIGFKVSCILYSLSYFDSIGSKMTHSLFSCMIPVFNISKKVLLPCSVRLRNSAPIWKTAEVRFVGGVAENSADTNARSLSLSKLESSAAQNENYESRLLKIAIIGVPNSGKSTVINQLVGRKVNTSVSYNLMSVAVSISIYNMICR
jgi:hypothetical protein